MEQGKEASRSEAMLVAGLLVALRLGACEDIEGFEQRYIALSPVTGGLWSRTEYCVKPGSAGLSQPYRGSNYCLVADPQGCCQRVLQHNPGGAPDTAVGCYDISSEHAQQVWPLVATNT